MIKKNIYTILLMFLCGSCSNTDDKINKYIESHCSFNGTDLCYIDIKDVLKIDYDKMYLFGETTMANEISKVIGIPYNNDKYISDSKYRIILLKDNKIVYEDDYYQKYTYFFSLANRIEENFYCALYTTSIFGVEKVGDNNRFTYILTIVEDNVFD